MKNSILASIALFGIYRNKNWDTYDLVSQYISAVIANKGYHSFTSEVIQANLKELFQIDIPKGVINSVCRNRIEGLSLNKGVFSCEQIPKDEIEKEYDDLLSLYDDLFALLVSFVKKETGEYESQVIKDRFTDYLVDGSTLDNRLNNLFAAFIASNQESQDIRHKIDVLSSGLISYNGLRYTESAGNSGAWTDRLTIYLDTEFLFSCAGYNDNYPQAVFDEFYGLVNEINTSYRRRTKKDDNLVELKYLKETRDVYLALINSAKSIIDTKAAPDPSKKALVKIVSESASVFDVDTHRARIDSAIKDKYHIQYDDKDYNYGTDRRYVLFDESTLTALSNNYNPQKEESTSRKIDYYTRVYTIINGLRGGESVSVFEKCRYIFLTGSRIGRGASQAVKIDNKTVSFATDIDFLVSRFWFKLNKQLVPNQIPVSLDIVARSQAVLTREVSRKVRVLYEELKHKDLSESEQRTLYANLAEAEKFLAPYSDTTTKDVLSFIDFKNVDELIDNQKELRRKVADAEKKEKELTEAKRLLEKQKQIINDLTISISDRDEEYQIQYGRVSKNEVAFKMRVRGLEIVLSILVALVIGLIIVIICK